MKKTGVFFDDEGNLYIPHSLKMCGELEPKLTPIEWFIWIFLTSNKPEKMKELSPIMGSRATIWRAKKSLKEKGYL